MSDTTASLRHKIKRAGDLQSVVRTMKSLAASSIVQCEQSVRALGDCARGGRRAANRPGGSLTQEAPSFVR
jgi:F0F1-type ATP synthase gamma subunit